MHAINKFIDAYDLFECGFDVETLRRHFYREMQKNVLLSRLSTRRHSSAK